MDVYLGNMQTLQHILMSKEEASHHMMENIYAQARCDLYFGQNVLLC
jgi:hypothetical protein